MAEQYYGTGRRKTSSARVFMRSGGGSITVNKKPIEDFFGRETSRMIVRQPLEALAVADKFHPCNLSRSNKTLSVFVALCAAMRLNPRSRHSHAFNRFMAPLVSSAIHPTTLLVQACGVCVAMTSGCDGSSSCARSSGSSA